MTTKLSMPGSPNYKPDVPKEESFWHKEPTATFWVILVAFIAFLWILGSVLHPSKPKPSGPIPIAAGDTCRLVSSNPGQLVPVAATQDDLNALMKADTAGDEVGRSQLRISGRVMAVEPQTQVLVLSANSLVIEIRIQSGRYAMRSGFTPAEFVARL